MPDCNGIKDIVYLHKVYKQINSTPWFHWREKLKNPKFVFNIQGLPVLLANVKDGDMKINKRMQKHNWSIYYLQNYMVVMLVQFSILTKLLQQQRLQTFPKILHLLFYLRKTTFSNKYSFRSDGEYFVWLYKSVFIENKLKMIKIRWK